MLLALLGDPVAHSRSPAIHNAALKALGISGRYEARRCDATGLEEAVAELRGARLTGANVTMPLKADALRCADRAGDLVIRAGAANILLLRGGDVWAENTDVAGVSDVWASRSLPAEEPMLVLGAGGAAAAALLAREGAMVYVSSRRLEAADSLLERTGVVGRTIPWETPVPGAVVVNATPLGMRGEVLPAAVIEEAAGLLDMAYGAEPTPAVRASRHLPVADGIDLLVAQAAHSFELWLDREAPRSVMEAAARR